MKRSAQIRIVGLLVVSLVLALAVPCFAQPGRRPGPPGPPGPPPRHHHRGPSDFDKTMRVIGAVGAAAAAANGYSPYGYYRRPQPVVVVQQPRPTTVVIEKAPVVVEKIIEKPVIVEREVVVEKTVPSKALPEDYYSPKLGATFKIQNMQIPGYKFKAARLTSDPLEGSPLEEIGLVKGDVVTRLDNDAVTELDVLESHEKNTLIRYIKSGTTKVQLGRVYIPTDAELHQDDDVFYAP